MPGKTGLTQADAENALAEALAARSALLNGAKSTRYSAGGVDRQITREDLASLNKDIIFWDAKVRELANGGQIRVYGVITPW